MTQVPAGVRTNTLALIGFIGAFVVPLLGVVLGVVALNQLRSTHSDQAGRGFARWGLIIGSLGLAVQIIFFIFWFALMGQALTGGRP